MEDAIKVFGWGENTVGDTLEAPADKTPANEDIKRDTKLVNLIALREAYPHANKVFYTTEEGGVWLSEGITKNKNEVWAMWASFKDGKMTLPDGHHEFDCYAVCLGQFSPRADIQIYYLVDTRMSKDSHPNGVLDL